MSVNVTQNYPMDTQYIIISMLWKLESKQRNYLITVDVDYTMKWWKENNMGYYTDQCYVLKTNMLQLPSWKPPKM